MFGDDDYSYVSVQIRTIVKALSMLFFHRDIPVNIIDESGFLSEDNFLLYRLKRLIYDGQINKAEDILFKEISESPSQANLKVAILFYNELNKLDQEYLQNCDFTQDEILEGLNQIKKIFYIDDLTRIDLE